jgi:class 3 adenylate cyclase/tetratricopeptide (TPR) repeat protein
VSPICARCGTEAGDGDRFCSTCGAPLETPEGAERKLATLLFADIVGSTQLAAGADPETLRGHLAPFFELTRAVISEHGGTVEKYIGDAVMAVFGVPRAHGDDPDRAIAAGLEMVGGLGERGIEIRVGIETGEVLAIDSGGDLAITGEAVNAASRLQTAANPGEVLAGMRAARSVLRAQLTGPREIEAKGFPAPLQAWHATGLLDEAEPTATPFLGRDDDLELLRLVYKRALRERVPELVTVTGEAGIGKTRLASELFDALRENDPKPTVLVGRNPPYGRGIALWALGEILRGAAGAGPDDSVAEVRDALARRLFDLGAEDADAVADGLAAALGGAEEGNVEEHLKHSWRRLVALLALEGPLIIGIDDAHWADDGLLDLVEEAAFRLEDAPVLVLCTSRPELLDRRPTFGRGARNVTQIELRPLATEAITELATVLLKSDAPGLAEGVARASGGNPFFAEEVACRFTDEPADGNGHAKPGNGMPETVQAAIAARLDLLPGDEKRTVQHAAVLGHAFLAEALAELMEAPVDAVLSELSRKSLFTERVAEGGGRFAFRHQLIRDVAYASLPRAQRATLHSRAADGIAGRAGARYPELAELVAYHRMEASSQDPSPKHAESAWHASIEAAEVVARRGASGRAQELFEQAVAIAPTDSDRLTALRAASHIAIRRFRGDEALRLAREEARIAEEAGENTAAAWAYSQAVEIAARMGGITGDVPLKELEAMLARAEELVGPDDLDTQTQIRLDHAWIAWRAGRSADMEDPAREALEMARKLESVTILSSALDAATAVEWGNYRYQSALEMTRERSELLENATDGSTAIEVERSDARHMMIESMLQTGDFRQAKEHATEAREADLSRGVVYSAWGRGLMPSYFLGEWDATVEMAMKVREAWAADNGPPVAVLASALAAAAAIFEFRGETSKATDWWDFAEGILPKIEGQTQKDGLRMLQGQALLHRGRIDEALETVLDLPEKWSWWGGHFAATRIEALALARRPDYETSRPIAENMAGDSRYLQALMTRAAGIHENSQEAIRKSVEVLDECGAVYQAARSRWLLGGKDRERALEVFDSLGAVRPDEE